MREERLIRMDRKMKEKYLPEGEASSRVKFVYFRVFSDRKVT